MPTSPIPALDRQLAHVFAPLDKRALGIALGSACAVLLGSITAIVVLRDAGETFPLVLLRQYFYGFEVTWLGVVTGTIWGFIVGFFWGWFFAFSRNLVLAIWLMTVRVRADMAASRVFLDHI